ncbi:MAG: hypothetical protein H7336_07605 [Bacteriovorax sp.]|nr:hypothetical protein [Bacteriovorax sp.]
MGLDETENITAVVNIFFCFICTGKTKNDSDVSALKLENNYYILPCQGAFCTLRTINNTTGPSDIEIIYDKTS